MLNYDHRKLTGMMESVRQGERQLLPGRQMVGRSRVSYTAVAGDPEVIQEVDVLVLFVTCNDKRTFALGTTDVHMHNYIITVYIYIIIRSQRVLYEE